jgi:hypothetical protein
MNPKGSKTVLSAHLKEADARVNMIAKTAIARGNHGFKVLKSNQRTDHLTFRTAK